MAEKAEKTGGSTEPALGGFEWLPVTRQPLFGDSRDITRRLRGLFYRIQGAYVLQSINKNVLNRKNNRFRTNLNKFCFNTLKIFRLKYSNLSNSISKIKTFLSKCLSFLYTSFFQSALLFTKQFWCWYVIKKVNHQFFSIISTQLFLKKWPL